MWAVVRKQASRAGHPAVPFRRRPARKGQKMKAFVVPVVVALAVLAGPLSAQTSSIPKVSSNPPAALAPSPSGSPVQHDPQVEVAFWESVKESDDPMLFLAYLEQFPNGAFRVIARNRLDGLWDRAIRAFALLDQLGVSVDDPSGGFAAPTPPPPTVPSTAPPVVVAPPVIVNPPPVIVRPASPPTPNPASWKTTRNAQNQLRKHGCYAGVVDGIWGEGSRKAMRRFNRRAGTTFKVAQPTPKAVNHMRDLSKLGIRICP